MRRARVQRGDSAWAAGPAWTPRRAGVVIATVSVLVAALAWSQPPDGRAARVEADPEYMRKFRAAQGDRRVLGVKDCRACHVSSVREDGTARNECVLWEGGGKGPHFLGYRTLEGERSRAIARRLHAFDGGGDDPTRRADCLSCHAFDPGERHRGADFEIADGVSCEACHGRAGERRSVEFDDDYWREKHTVRTWKGRPAEHWLKAGLFERRNPLHWAPMCLRCHLGDAERPMTHALLGAGHPALTFELASDIENVPRHWRDERHRLEGESPQDYRARLWAVGQATTLREAALQLVDWADDSAAPRPDYALLDCYACHHEFLSAERWAPRQAAARGPGPGEPAWNAASWTATRYLVEARQAERLADFEREIATIVASLRLRAADRTAVRRSAVALADLAWRLGVESSERRFDAAARRDVSLRIARDAERLYDAGPLGIEQACRALAALGAGRSDEVDPLRAALDRLEALIYDRDAGDAPPPELTLRRLDVTAFTAIMRDVETALAPP